MSANPNDKNFDWFDFLKLDINEMSEEYCDKAIELSGQWVTCACGQLCSGLPKYGPNNEPRDEELYELGMKFMFRVKNLSDTRNDFFATNEEPYLRERFYHIRLHLNTILCSIEARSSLLLGIQNGQATAN
jgi:hypothetical protein